VYANAINVRTLVIAVAVAMLLLLGAGVAYATGGDSSAQPTGSNIEKAKSAALDHTNGGNVTGTEVGDEEGYYEIEVTNDDGSQADVHLDRDFNVLTTASDNENPDDKDEPNDD
jgi:Peptidase propeptide and YPEB domain